MNDLTDKWKKGELPDGFYWCDVDIYEDGNTTKQIENFIHHHPVFYWETSIVRVIELVPSFSKYKSMQKENAQLKELLKECKHIMSIEKDFTSCHFEKDKLCNLLTKINQVLGE